MYRNTHNICRKPQRNRRGAPMTWTWEFLCTHTHTRIACSRMFVLDLPETVLTMRTLNKMIIWLLLPWPEGGSINRRQGSGGQKENDMKESGRSSGQPWSAFTFFFFLISKIFWSLKTGLTLNNAQTHGYAPIRCVLSDLSSNTA